MSRLVPSLPPFPEPRPVGITADRNVRCAGREVAGLLVVRRSCWRRKPADCGKSGRCSRQRFTSRTERSRRLPQHRTDRQLHRVAQGLVSRSKANKSLLWSGWEQDVGHLVSVRPGEIDPGGCNGRRTSTSSQTIDYPLVETHRAARSGGRIPSEVAGGRLQDREPAVRLSGRGARQGAGHQRRGRRTSVPGRCESLATPGRGVLDLRRASSRGAG